jgi:hypothetical protein
MDGLVDLPPLDAVQSIITRVRRLDRASRIFVLMGVFEDVHPDIHFRTGEVRLDILWRLFVRWWPDFEFPHRLENLVDLLRGAHRDVPAYAFMDPADQNFFDRLPDPVTVYQGTSGVFKSGVSWTTDKDTAEWFARRFANEAASVASGENRETRNMGGVH